VGDLFSVLKPGRKVVHPVTGKVIGTLEEPKGFLKITRIKTGFSFARTVGPEAKISPGDPIRRYESLQAFFWDYSGKARQFGSRLEKELSWLIWQPYNATLRSEPETRKSPDKTQLALYFILSENRLDVRGPDFTLLHRYQLSGEVIDEPKEAFVPLRPPDRHTVKDIPDLKKGGYSVAYDRSESLGTLPGVTVMADFIRSDGQLLMATTDGLRLNIFEITDTLTPMAAAQTPYPGQILAVKWWQPKKRRSPYLTVNFWIDNKVSSLIYALEGSRLTLVKDRISRILGAFDTDGDGKPETLLGQTYDREVFYGRDIKELMLTSGKFRLTKPALTFPRRFTVLGSQIADITGDGKLETIFIRNGVLHVHHGKQRIYSSTKKMGGSISILTYDIDPTTKDVMTTSAFFEVSPVVKDIDSDGRLEILVVSTDRPSIGAPGIGAGIKESQIAVLKHLNGRFEIGKIGSQMDRPIQGLAASERRILFVATEPEMFLGKNGKSHLMALPLAMR
jgi:hypothetical protein